MEPMGDVSKPSSLDPDSLGFMCGLEIHQQLATGKLHSRMPSELYDFGIDDIPDDWGYSERRLRASRGEGGKIDVAARFEQRRNRTFAYVQPPNAGLIELDEAPPLPHDREAVDIVLTMSALLQAKPVPALQPMRKTVVDGSNTSGFQRTTLVSTNGQLITKTGEVGVSVICLEEDSARKLETKSTPEGELVTYTLDRLGLPLVEIATDPDIVTPEHAKESALALGSLLRDTRRVRRGLGSIRQDLNVSIACGDRVEIKGCQDLEWIPRIIRIEMARQLHMYRLANQLRDEAKLPPLPYDRRNTEITIENRVAIAAKSRVPMEFHDISESLSSCESSMVKKALSEGASPLAVRLPGFSGKLGTKSLDNEGSQLPRLGRELASAAKLAGIAGIFHSDELPAYGISEEDVVSIRSSLMLSEGDAFAFCVAPYWQAKLALESVVDRSRKAYHRIPQEVRNVVIKKGQPDDGTTTALRPLPGGARMYPETDIPLQDISIERWKLICSSLPLSTEERSQRLSTLDISSNQAESILNGELDDILFEGIEGELALPAKAWASALLEFGSSNVNALSVAIHLRESGQITRDGILPLIKESTGSKTSDLIDWMVSEAKSRGFIPADNSDVENAVEEIMIEKADFISERGMASVGPLMGLVMQKLGGSADGKIVSQILRDKISSITDS
ncbi:MAG TPA: Glu-tRNA(Gln) amidotransferase subunit GatE [Candidatus Thalassarchaeaceae archaeon]|nr:MAG TPA: Glu-tRNA(Gln) amidotransferase GatDE subunit E [Candidatus Poseidoniales archaeon]HII34570.1 Glu-tRNA(Gln) amidotransferase subunit GatE [Candidatus Thalassarchaeaceae archaeon]|tara:strand:+ start:2206 stop:4239 length:2034 start_codon:yes stop_codon:yes gene_type:complete